jgi:hypothetical protein
MMLYEKLADIHQALASAMWELRSRRSAQARAEALDRAHAALDRLDGLVAFIGDVIREDEATASQSASTQTLVH